MRARAVADPRVQALAGARGRSDEARAAYERRSQRSRSRSRPSSPKSSTRIHSVERAREVGSLEEIVAPAAMRPYLIGLLDVEALS